MYIVILSKILKEWNMQILTRCVSEFYVNRWSYSCINVPVRYTEGFEVLSSRNLIRTQKSISMGSCTSKKV